MFLLIPNALTQETSTVSPTQTQIATTESSEPSFSDDLLSGFFDEDITQITQDTNYENTTLTSDFAEFPKKLDLAKANIKSALKELAKGGPPVPKRYKQTTSIYYYVSLTTEPYNRAIRTCKREGAEFYEITQDADADITKTFTDSRDRKLETKEFWLRINKDPLINHGFYPSGKLVPDKVLDKKVIYTSTLEHCYFYSPEQQAIKTGPCTDEKNFICYIQKTEDLDIKIQFHKAIQDNIKDITRIIIPKPVRTRARELFKKLPQVKCPATNTQESLLNALGLINPVHQLTEELVLTPSAFETAVRQLKADVKAFVHLAVIEDPFESIMAYLGINTETSYIAYDKLAKALCFIKDTVVPQATELISSVSEELAKIIEYQPSEIYQKIKEYTSDPYKLTIIVLILVGTLLTIICLCTLGCMCCKKCYRKYCKKERANTVKTPPPTPPVGSIKRKVSFKGLTKSNSDNDIYELPRILRRSSSIRTFPSPTPFRKSDA